MSVTEKNGKKSDSAKFLKKKAKRIIHLAESIFI